MKNLHKSILELIGNTPMLEINNFDLQDNINIFAKLEFYNPGGSVKDRIGKTIIKKAEEEGELKEGYTIIEATAGNTGIGLALAAINRGYEIIFVVPDKFSIEKQLLMKALGAEIINTPAAEGLEGAFKKVDELAREREKVFIPDQFNNINNVEAHYEFTAKEIYSQLDGEVDYFISGAGTGGTFTGVMKFLKEKNQNVKGVLADPVGSIIGGGICGSYKIEGIGNDFIPSIMDLSMVDDVIKVSDEHAFEMVKKLALKEGLLVGSSAGASFYAALKKAEEIQNGNMVVILPDRYDRYLSKETY